ncbi:MAG: FecR domain-containing protein [Sphingobacteriia bacterium]|nr:FecR domain-containing protein [Sphingobacteriia bacterium]
MEPRYTPEEFTVLLQRYIENRYSREDVDLLTQLIDEPAYHGLAMELIEGTLHKIKVEEGEIAPDVLERLRNKLPGILGEEQAAQTSARPSVSVLRRMRWAAAAAILLVAGTAAYFLLQPKQPAGSTAQPIADVKAPEKNRAMITLENGKTIYLDSVGNGQLAAMGAVKLVKLANGQIRYSGKASDIAYHTLTNPRGSQPIDMTLSDGSRVWLNAGSSITYPIAFVAGQHRKVNMTGEAYFEVAHDAANPFYVSRGGMEVKVLGTHFNVNAYDNEGAYKVTLLEGVVAVKKATGQLLLKPGQQAQVNQTVTLETAVDLEQVMAWKNGATYFTNADLGVVLRELERWYDIKAEVKGTLGSKRFYLDAPRSASLQDVLKSILEDNQLRYAYDANNRTLTVHP